MPSKLKITAVLLLLASIGYFATDIYLPSLPALAEAFQVDDALVRFTLFSYMFSFSFTPLFFGPLSDHMGRKNIVHFGLLLSLLSTLGCIFSPSIYWFITARFFQGIGNGATMIAARSMVTDIFKGKALATQISYITMSMPVVLAMAPLIGGYLQEVFDWQMVFLFLFFYIMAIALITLTVEESLEHAAKRHISLIFQGYKEILAIPNFILFGLGMAIPAVGVLAYLTSSPFLFQQVIGLSPGQYGSLALGIGGAVMFSSYINVHLLKVFSINTILAVGCCFMLLAGVLLLCGHMAGVLNTWTVLIPTMFYFCSVPFTTANSISKALSQIKHRFGGANAVLTSGQFMAGTLGTLLFSFIPVKDALPIALCFLGVGLISSLALYFAIRSEKKS